MMLPRCILLFSWAVWCISAQDNTINEPLSDLDDDMSKDITIECNNKEIRVNIDTTSKSFTGIVYPKGLAKNSSCMAEFNHQKSPVVYRLPLRSCNTMSTYLNDGIVEYFNTIVLQPHRKLVTNQGKGFHIRCKYQTNEQSLTNVMNMSTPEETSMVEGAKMPTCIMKIFSGKTVKPDVAENVKIGDPLTMVISIDSEDTFGLFITDCLVRDGLGWGDQRLIDKYGCSIEDEIMGQFQYSENKTTAVVNFQAHKFPYTTSVYYQCHVHLCTKANGGCANTPPNCSNKKRIRREDQPADDESPATIEVYSGLYVNEAADSASPEQMDQVAREKISDDPYSICISQRNFAISIAIAGLILMLLTVITALILLTRRNKKTLSSSGSSVYSGPYTNTAYSHTS
ncbi:cuticlin-4 [Adelges cooleyi]|uniref:cuticlin-4 n=1 Tax=Adelges cooleyi TaxID=133065 RepID=UPI0021805929|nr:cuticlin-4 [Adelges cooleyi]